jgi:DNA-binding response OmpR family regulator
MLMEYLTAFPFVEAVDWADTESKAVGLAAAGAYHVAIVDLQLRQGNGINVLREMQKARFPASASSTRTMRRYRCTGASAPKPARTISSTSHSKWSRCSG